MSKKNKKQLAFAPSSLILANYFPPVNAALCEYPMKYKNIDSALHNFGQSFLSGMNYFENDHVMYDVFNVARNLNGETFLINFSTDSYYPATEVNSRIEKSISHYSDRLSGHLISHNLDPKSLGEITLSMRSTNMGFDAYMDATDDKGNEHHVYVNLA